MNQLATLRRRLHLIRLVSKPFLYPSKQKLVEQLQQDFDAISERTVERDITQIGREYGIRIRADRQRGGYFLDLPTDEDVADFDQFVQLLERCERLDFLTSAVHGVSGAGRYLQLESTPAFTGTEHLPTLWNALRSERCVQFVYRKFAEPSASDLPRLIEPGLLFEYRNRWYLDGLDTADGHPKTFGLDRISGLIPTDRPVKRTAAAPLHTDRRHVIGVTAPANAEPERVVLRVQTTEANYLKTLPLHTSQRIVQETDTFTDFELTVLLNHELEREILAFGELVEVLEPVSLREKIAGRVAELHQRYATRNSG